MNPDGDDAARAEIRLVQSEARRKRDVAGASRALLLDQAALAVVALPGGELLAMAIRRPRRAVRPSEIEPIGALSKMVCADMEDLVRMG